MKRRYGYRETKRKRKRLLLPRGMVEETIRIQRGEEEVEEKVPTYYPYIGLKKRYGYIETTRTMRCLLCICRMV